MKKTVLGVIIFFSAVALLSADGIYKRVKFQKGHSSIIYAGAVIHDDTDTYIIRINKGQTLKASVTSVQNNAVLSISSDKTGKNIESELDSNKTIEFSGTIQESADYKILVSPSQGNASYKLYIEVENPYFEF